ncbi:unnamed protein product [Aphanomyces euteiches]
MSAVRSVCLVPSGLLNFEGKIMPNAHTFADLDGDGNRELIVGAMSGKVAIFKGLSSSNSICEYTVDGCITAIVTHRIGVESSQGSSVDTPYVMLVMTAEGTCFVLHRKVHRTDDVKSAFALDIHAQFTIPFNVSAADMIDSKLVVGTRDGTIHVFDIQDLDHVKEIKKHRLPGEVESFVRSKPGLLLVCLHTGEVLEVTAESAIVVEHGESLQCGRAYILSGLKSKDVDSCDAFGYFNGQVHLKHSTTNEILWRIQLPDALLMMASIHLFQDGGEEIVLCCWNGDVYLINTLGSQLKFTIPFSITAFFSGSFSTATGSEDVIFCATTSGGILYYVGIGQSIRHIRHDSVMDVITHSSLYSSIDTPAKRRAVLLGLRQHLPAIQLDIPDEPTLQECIRACVYASNALMEPPSAPADDSIDQQSLQDTTVDTEPEQIQPEEVVSPGVAQEKQSDNDTEERRPDEATEERQNEELVEEQQVEEVEEEKQHEELEQTTDERDPFSEDEHSPPRHTDSLSQASEKVDRQRQNGMKGQK